MNLKDEQYSETNGGEDSVSTPNVNTSAKMQEYESKIQLLNETIKFGDNEVANLEKTKVYILKEFVTEMRMLKPYLSKSVHKEAEIFFKDEPYQNVRLEGVIEAFKKINEIITKGSEECGALVETVDIFNRVPCQRLLKAIEDTKKIRDTLLNNRRVIMDKIYQLRALEEEEQAMPSSSKLSF